MLTTNPHIYSYIVARDFGFAPNPFFGVCTLATCKPELRRTCQLGDWVLGIGSANYDLQGHLVYAMEVGEALSFDHYWADRRFRQKRPNLHGSLRSAFGDNIYRHDKSSREWVQLNSHHSLPDGSPNPNNIAHDTQTDRVLISRWFVYFGREAPRIPSNVRERLHGQSRGHSIQRDPAITETTLEWVRSIGSKGYVGEPAEFERELTLVSR
jgi:hypothetical protein